MLSHKFGVVYDDPMSELMSLRHSGIVIEYLDQFETILTRMGFSEEYKINYFLTGLEYETQMQVQIFTPKSVQQAGKSAKLYQAAKVHKPKPSVFVNHSKSHFPPGANPPYTKINTNSSQPLLPLPNTTKIVKAQTLHKPYRSYSAAEQNERRMKGLCMYCDEKYTLGHNLKHKRAQFYVFEGEDDDSGSEPCICVSAIIIHWFSTFSDYKSYWLL